MSLQQQWFLQNTPFENSCAQRRARPEEFVRGIVRGTCADTCPTSHELRAQLLQLMPAAASCCQLLPAVAKCCQLHVGRPARSTLPRYANGRCARPEELVRGAVRGGVSGTRRRGGAVRGSLFGGCAGELCGGALVLRPWALGLKPWALGSRPCEWVAPNHENLALAAIVGEKAVRRFAASCVFMRFQHMGISGGRNLSLGIETLCIDALGSWIMALGCSRARVRACVRARERAH